MPQPDHALLRALLHQSPSLRNILSFWYRRTHSMFLFGSDRGVRILENLVLDDRQDAAFAEKQALVTECSSVLPSVSVLWGGDVDFSSRKVALLAHWDKDARIDPYVVYYAEHLHKHGFAVVLCSGSPVSVCEAQAGPFAAVLYRSCPGYDFTSWKAALEALPSVWNAAELFLTNDSIFAPIGDFGPVLATMEKLPCDVWGFVESCGTLPHLQSYAILLRERALRSEALRVFFQHVPCDSSRAAALALEQLLTLWLVRHGLSAGAWLPACALPWPWFNPLHRTWKQMPAMGIAILKRDMFLGRPGIPFPRQWFDIAARYGYPREMIAGYLARVLPGGC